MNVHAGIGPPGATSGYLKISAMIEAKSRLNSSGRSSMG
jgi:hypothetical protein